MQCGYAAFQAEDGRGVTGGVLRDDEGRFLQAQAIAYTHCMDALMGEALACRDGSWHRVLLAYAWRLMTIRSSLLSGRAETTADHSPNSLGDSGTSLRFLARVYCFTC